MDGWDVEWKGTIGGWGLSCFQQFSGYASLAKNFKLVMATQIGDLVGLQLTSVHLSSSLLSPQFSTIPDTNTVEVELLNLRLPDKSSVADPLLTPALKISSNVVLPFIVHLLNHSMC